MDYGNGITSVADFVSAEDAHKIIDWINNNYQDKFVHYEFMNNPQRYALRFGKDQVFWDTSSWDIVGVDDLRPTVEKYMAKVVEFAKQYYRYPGNLYVNSFWLAKQLAGAFVKAHNDCDSAHNPQFTHSIICYLNDNENGGELEFPQLGVKIKPVAGDMVIFPAQGEELVHEVSRISQDRYTMLFWLTDNPDYEVKFHIDECQYVQSSQ